MINHKIVSMGKKHTSEQIEPIYKATYHDFNINNREGM